MEILESCIGEHDQCMQVYQDDFAILMKYENQEDLEHRWLHEVVDKIFEIDHPAAYHNIYTSFGIYLLQDTTCSFEEA